MYRCRFCGRNLDVANILEIYSGRIRIVTYVCNECKGRMENYQLVVRFYECCGSMDIVENSFKCQTDIHSVRMCGTCREILYPENNLFFIDDFRNRQPKKTDEEEKIIEAEPLQTAQAHMA